MKKYPFFAVVALAAWGLTSCDEYTLPNPPAQSNEQEKEFVQGDVSLTDRVNGKLINLYSAATQNHDLQLLDVTIDYIPQGYGLKVVGEMAKTSEFADCASFPCYFNADSTGCFATAADMEAAVVEVFGHNPSEKKAVVRYALYAVNGSSEYRIGDPNTYVTTTSFDIQPIGPGHEVYAKNYLITSANNWAMSGAIPMIQTTVGDPYDFPEFTAEFTTTEPNTMYKVLDDHIFASGTISGYGVADPSAMSGELVDGVGDNHAGVIPVQGDYKITVDMLHLTYRLNYNFPVLYVANASSTDASTLMQLPTDNRSYYRGVAVLANNFWLATTAGDLKVGFSNAAATTSGDWDYSGKLQYSADATQNAMVVKAQSALYLVVANIGDGTWMANEIKSIGAVGDFQGWDPASAPKFTASRTKKSWTITNLQLNGNDFKFCANGGWGINFGGSLDNLVVDGGNISNYGGPGKYDITLDFSKLPYTATMVKK